jgi:replicative DNA helicase
MDDVIGKLSAKQRLFERWFAVAAMSDPDVAISEYSWLSPDVMLDPQVAHFWREFLANGGDPDKAAAASNTIQELSEAVNEIHDLKRIDVYADGIVTSSRLLRMAIGAKDLMGSCNFEDVNLATQALAQINASVEAITINSDKVKSSIDIAANFAGLIAAGFDSIPTGIGAIDQTIGRLQRRQVSVLASRTSVGKTALAWQIARQIAVQKYKVLYVSTEMTAEDLWARAASGAAGIDWRKIVSGTASQGEKASLMAQSNQLVNQFGDNLFVDDDSYTPEEIHRKVAKIKPDYLVVDHLDELRKPTDYRLVEWLAEIMTQLKYIAKKYNLHCMAVHQINRAAEDRNDKRPQLADLRNSGDIEQKADAVFMLHRPDLYSDKPETNISYTEFWIRKNRMGSRDSLVKLDFVLSDQWFRSPMP